MIRSKPATGTQYIRRVIERMNRDTHARLRTERPAEISKKVLAGSLPVNEEFAAVGRDPDA